MYVCVKRRVGEKAREREAGRSTEREGGKKKRRTKCNSSDFKAKMVSELIAHASDLFRWVCFWQPKGILSWTWTTRKDIYVFLKRRRGMMMLCV